MKKYVNYSRDIPTVIFDSNLLEAYMIDFMKENLGKNVDVNRYLGLVMLRLGFKSDDVIEFENFNIDKKEDYFICKVNDNKNYNIKFYNVGNRKLHTMIALSYFNREITFECFPLMTSELGVRIAPVKDKTLYEDGISFTRELSREDAKFNVMYDDYKLELDVVKPRDYKLSLYDNNGRYNRYRLNNEEELIKYLNDFFKILSCGDIVSVYKKICEISFSDGISKYPEINLIFSCGGKITDMICLRDGELEKFGVTLLKLGRNLFLDKDGKWLYEISNVDNLFNIKMDVNEDGINYNIHVKSENEIDMVREIIRSDTGMIRDNIVHIKRLVKKTFKNVDSSN